MSFIVSFNLRIQPTWNLLSFLNVFYLIWELLEYYFLEYYLCPLFSFFSFPDSQNVYLLACLIVGCLIVHFSSFLYFWSKDSIISIVLISCLLIVSSICSNLPLNLSSKSFHCYCTSQFQNFYFIF